MKQHTRPLVFPSTAQTGSAPARGNKLQRSALYLACSCALAFGLPGVASAQSVEIDNGDMVVVAGDGSGTQPSPWTINGKELFVGDIGEGTLIIQKAGQVSVKSDGGVVLGAGEDAEGTVTLSGTESSFSTSGGMMVGGEGAGLLSLSNNASVGSKFLFIGKAEGSSGMVTVTNANMEGAGLHVTSDDMDDTYPGMLGVGINGDGELQVSAGGFVYSDDGWIGAESGTGRVTVTGENSLWSTDTLVVGKAGTGTLLVDDHGGVITEYLDVADAGSGTVKVSGAGTLHSDDGARVAGQTGSNGTVTVTGTGSTWTVGNTLAVAGHGTGMLRIADGGTVESGSSAIAAGLGLSESGTVTVTGKDSLWQVNGNLSVSDGGKGELHILDGGAVKVDGPVTVYGGDKGSATVTVTGSGSIWDISGTLQLGTYGDGTLTITDGGTVHANGVRLKPQDDSGVGTINIGAASGAAAAAAGILDTPTLAFGTGSGTSTLVFNHTDTGYTFDTALSDAGLVQHEAGHTSLNADSSGFTGTTLVDGGTLVVAGKLGGAATANGGELQVDGTFNGDVTAGGGGTIAGSGTIAGDVSMGPDGILQGVQGQTLTMNTLTLNDSSQVNVTLGAPDKDAGLFAVHGDLTLAGTLNVTDAGDFGAGVYRLFDYGGTLTQDGLAVGTTPVGFEDGLTVQTSVANQVNLAVGGAAVDMQFWDGAGPTDNGAIDGGEGTWTADTTDTHWTSADGSNNDAYDNPTFAVFQGKAGTVTIDNTAGQVSADGLQFAVDGYTLDGDKLTLTGDSNDPAFLRVGDGTSAGSDFVATIKADLMGLSLHKTDLGTLVLSGNDSMLAEVEIDGGTLQLTDGASINDGLGGIVLGLQGAKDGTLILTGGATLASAGAPFTLIVGAYGAGKVVIADGSQAFTNNTNIGYQPGSTGKVTVTGTNSILSIEQDVYVGSGGGGNGILTLAAGGTVSVGHNGGGSIDLASDAGVTGTINMGATAGQNAVAPGVLQARFLFFGPAGSEGDGTLVFNHTATNYTFDTALYGAGLVQHEAGHTSLSADSSGFTGTTLVDGGTLVVANKLGGAATANGGTLQVDGTFTGDVAAGGGGTVSGSGTIAGTVSIESDGILQGVQGQTLTMNTLTLRDGSRVNVSLGTPGNTNALFAVNGNLTLNGTLNVTDVGDFGAGVYRLMDYTGTLTGDGLDIGTTPSGFADGLSVQTSVNHQINLVADAADLTFWDGSATSHAGNGAIDGGDGTWTASGATWTDADGNSNGAMTPSPGFAIFQGQAGTVTIDAADGAVKAQGLQFASDGYVLTGDTLTLTKTGGTIRVGDGTDVGAAMTATIHADVSAAGTVYKKDLGTLVLTGSNTWGAAYLLNGTLQLSDGGSAHTGAVTLGDAPGDVGILDIGADSTWTASDAVHAGFGGEGTIRLHDGGTLTAPTLQLAGFDVGTGTLVIGAAEGEAATAVGTLDADTLTFGSDFGVGDGTVVFNHTDSDYTFATTLVSVQAGAGTLKQLAGYTDLSGDSHGFSGHTIVAGGTLAVDGILGGTLDVAKGGTLAGNGTVGDTTVASGGVVAPGHSIGKLTVDGNLSFAAGSVYAVEVDPSGTDSDRIHATGKATLQGGSVMHVGSDGDYQPDASYTILSADKGVSGHFDKVASDFAFLAPSLTYDAHSVTLELQRNRVDFDAIGHTRNQKATAGGIEALGTGNAVYAAVVTLNEAGARAAFDELSGESFASTRAALLQDSRYVREAMNTRLQQAGTARDKGHAISGTAGTFWTHAWGHWGSADGDGNAARAKANGSGLLMGIDAPLGDHLRGGLTAGTGQSSMSEAARHSDAHSKNTHVGAYLGGTWGGWKVNGGVAGSWHRIDSHRSVNLAIPGRVYANYDARTLQAFVEGGYRFATAHGRVEPYVNVTHVAVRTDSFDEKGSAAALQSNRETTEVDYGTLGVHGQWQLSGQGATRISAYGTLGWRHAFGDNVAVAQNRFAGGDRFTVAGVPWAKDAALVQAGIDFALGEHTSFRAGYSGLLSDHVKDHAAKLSLRVDF